MKKQIEEMIECVEGLQGSQLTDEDIVLMSKLRNELHTKLKNLLSESGDNQVDVKLSIFDVGAGAIAEAAAVLAVAILEKKYILHEIPDYDDLYKELEKSAEANDDF